MPKRSKISNHDHKNETETTKKGTHNAQTTTTKNVTNNAVKNIQANVLKQGVKTINKSILSSGQNLVPTALSTISYTNMLVLGGIVVAGGVVGVVAYRNLQNANTNQRNTTTNKTPVSVSQFDIDTTKTTDVSVTLFWTPLQGASNYKIYRKDHAISTYDSNNYNTIPAIDTSNNNATISSYTVISLTPDSSYDFKILPVMTDASQPVVSRDAATSPIQTLLSAVSGFTVVSGSLTASSLQLQWTSKTGASFYTIKFKAVTDTNYALLATNLIASTTTYNVTQLKPSTSYTFQITATSSSTGLVGMVATSNPVTTLLTAVTGFAAIDAAKTYTSIQLMWDADTTGTTANYTITYRLTGSSSNFAPITTTANTNVVAYPTNYVVVKGLQYAMDTTTPISYDFQIIPSDSTGNSGSPTFVTASTDISNTGFDILWVNGQSNSTGWGQTYTSTIDSTDTSPMGDLSVLKDANGNTKVFQLARGYFTNGTFTTYTTQQWSLTDNSDVLAAIEPLHHLDFVKSASWQSPGWALTAAKRIVGTATNPNPDYPINRAILIVHGGLGNTGFAQINPFAGVNDGGYWGFNGASKLLTGSDVDGGGGIHLYTTDLQILTICRAQVAMQRIYSYIDSHGTTHTGLAANNKILACMWHQGEFDTGSDMSGLRYNYFVDRIMNVFRSSIPGVSYKFPFINGGFTKPSISPTNTGFLFYAQNVERDIQSINQRQYYTATAATDVTVNEDGTTTNGYIWDSASNLALSNIHFSAPQLRALGRTYYDAYQQAKLNTPYLPGPALQYVQQVGFDTTTITLTWLCQLRVKTSNSNNSESYQAQIKLSSDSSYPPPISIQDTVTNLPYNNAPHNVSTTFSNLQPNTSYTIKLWSVNENNINSIPIEYTAATTSNTIVPQTLAAAPTLMTGTLPTPYNVSIQWVANTSFPLATAYNIVVSKNQSGSPALVTGANADPSSPPNPIHPQVVPEIPFITTNEIGRPSTLTNVRTATITGLESGTTYYIFVIPTNPAGAAITVSSSVPSLQVTTATYDITPVFANNSEIMYQPLTLTSIANGTIVPNPALSKLEGTWTSSNIVSDPQRGSVFYLPDRVYTTTNPINGFDILTFPTTQMTTEYTKSIWVKPQSGQVWGGTCLPLICSYPASGAGSHNFFLRIAGNYNKLYVFQGYDPNATGVTLDDFTSAAYCGPMQNDVWCHLVATYNGTTVGFYLNGVPSTPLTQPSSTGNTTWANATKNPVAFGYTQLYTLLATATNNQNDIKVVNPTFLGSIAQARIFNTALTATQVQNLYYYDLQTLAS